MTGLRALTPSSEKPEPAVCECGALVEPVWFGKRAGWIVGSECDLCLTRRERIERDRQEEQKRQRLLQKANLPPEAEDWDFERAEAGARRSKAGQDLEVWLKAHYHCRTWPTSSRKGFYLMGPTGTGKTVLGYCLVKAAIAEGVSAAFISVSEMLQEMRRTFAQDSRARDLAGLAEEVRVLVLDDIGAEKPRGILRDTLLRIINARIGRRRPTHYITNCIPRELRPRLEDQHGRMVSRILGSTQGLYLKGKDFRLMEEEAWLL